MNARLFMILLAVAPALSLFAEEEAAVGAVPEPAVEAEAAPATVEVEEETLPTGFPVTRYTAIWENSPFNREVVAAAAKTIESSFAQSLVLEGVINDDVKGPVAYVRDKREDKSLVITSAKNESHPYTIVSANQSRRAPSSST